MWEFPTHRSSAIGYYWVETSCVCFLLLITDLHETGHQRWKRHFKKDLPNTKVPENGQKMKSSFCASPGSLRSIHVGKGTWANSGPSSAVAWAEDVCQSLLEHCLALPLLVKIQNGGRIIGSFAVAVDTMVPNGFYSQCWCSRSFSQAVHGYIFVLEVTPLWWWIYSSSWRSHMICYRFTSQGWKGPSVSHHSRHSLELVRGGAC